MFIFERSRARARAVTLLMCKITSLGIQIPRGWPIWHVDVHISARLRRFIQTFEISSKSLHPRAAPPAHCAANESTTALRCSCMSFWSRRAIFFGSECFSAKFTASASRSESRQTGRRSMVPAATVTST